MLQTTGSQKQIDHGMKGEEGKGPDELYDEEWAMEIHAHEVDMPLLDAEKLRKWVELIARGEEKFPGQITIVFCSDAYLLQMNQKYLRHDAFTDIITFDLSDKEEEISGEMYISTHRVADNARDLGEDPGRELHRVMAHGLLHLMGYRDGTREETAAMRARENYYLSLIP